MERPAAGQQNAIPCDDADALFAAYADMVYRLAFLRTKRTQDAEDVLQDVFLRCLRRRPVWNDAAHQKAWFLRVTVNCCNSLLTSAFRRHTAPEQADAKAVEMEDNTEVYAAVLRLPDKYRTLVHLFYYEGYGVREIAELLHMPENTVKSHLFRARDILRNELKGAYCDV